jgi:hypothetical protein
MLVAAALNERGICRLDDAYSGDEISRLNRGLDDIFKARALQKRSYVHVDELHERGMLELLLGERMLDILFSIMPDPVLYHCIAIETAGNDPEPNLFAETLAGWHRDRDCSFTTREPTHVSIFVYLSDVGEDDGAFEFVPQNPNERLRSSTPCALVTGRSGYTFAWQRSYFHRASPNRGPGRRRLAKLSIQRNSFPSIHLSSERFKKVIAAMPSGDPATDVLFGRYQGRKAPSVDRPDAPVTPYAIAPTGTMLLDDGALKKGQFRMKVAALTSDIKAMVGGAARRTTYD